MLGLYSIEELKQRISVCDSVFIFGTGNRFKLLTELFELSDFQNKIKGLMDNSVEKQNTYAYWGKNECENKYIIRSMQETKPFIEGDTVIIVTPESMYVEMCDLLNKDELFNKCEIVCLTHTIAIECELSSMSKKAFINNVGNMKIPKIIHYFWFGNNPVLEKYKTWMESWKKYCPDYEIIQWNEKNYDITKNKYMKQAYDSKKWGFVPDYARMDIINKYGGIYFDTDVELVKNLDDLLYDNAFMGFQENGLVNLGHGFGSKKDNELLEEMMELYDRVEFINEDGSLNMMPSPHYQTEVLKKNGLKLNGEQQVIKGNVIYPEKMFCAKNIKTMVINTKEYTHSVHHFDGSWSDDYSKNYNKRLEEDLGGYYRWRK